MPKMLSLKKEYKPLIKSIFVFGLPLVAGRLSQYFHQVTDSAMMGHFGEKSNELAAIALAGLFTWLLSTLLWPIGSGIQALITRKKGAAKIGKSDNHEIGRIFDNGIVCCLIMIVVTFLLSFSAGPVLKFLIYKKNNPDQFEQYKAVWELSIQYIDIIRFSLIPLALHVIATRFFSSIKKAKYVMVSSLLSNLLNVLFNYLFIFGPSFFPAMGIRGAALGTLLSQSIGFIYILVILLKKTYLKKYLYFRFKGIKKSIIKRIFKIAIPPGLQNFLAFSFMLLYESRVVSIGESAATGVTALAATHAAFSAFRINKTLVGGFAHSTAILVGNELGANNKVAAKKLVIAGQLIALSVGIVVFILAFFFPNVLAHLFSKDGETIAEITKAFRFFAIFYFVEITAFTLEMVFIGNGYGKYVLASEFSTNLLFIIGFTFLFTSIVTNNVYVAWLGFGLYQLFHAGILHIGFLRGKWKDVEFEK